MSNTTRNETTIVRYTIIRDGRDLSVRSVETGRIIARETYSTVRAAEIAEENTIATHRACAERWQREEAEIAALATEPDSITLRDRGRGQIHLTVRNGVVVGAMGSEPARYIGLAIDRARHVARYGGRGQAVAS